MAKRKPLSKSLRFKIFKRDGFACQYCGNTPPATVLEIDHITPVSKKGTDDEDNLLTSCFECNRGKGDELLTIAPEGIDKKSEVLAEKEEQLKEYNKLIAAKKRREARQVNKISRIFDEVGNLTASDKNTIRNKFLSRLMVDEVEDAMYSAINKFNHNPNAAWKYFCGICWNKIKERGESYV